MTRPLAACALLLLHAALLLLLLLLLLLCAPQAAQAQVNGLPGLVRNAIPTGCSAPVGNPVFYDSATSTRIASSTRSQSLSTGSINSSPFTVNTLAYHLQASDCGVTVSGSVSAGDVFSGATVQTPSFTLNGSNSHSFVVLQPLNRNFPLPQVDVVLVSITTAMGSVTVYGNANIDFLQVALLNCPAGTFGVQASAIVASSSYSLGPTIPAACTEVVGNPFVNDGSSFTIGSGSSSGNSEAVQTFGSTSSARTFNAMAVHVLGTYSLSSSSVYLVTYTDSSRATSYLPAGSITGVYAAPFNPSGSFTVASGTTVLLQLYDIGSTAAFGGTASAPQLQLLNCQSSAFTALGGSEPAVVCPPVSSSAVSSSVRSSSALSSSRVSSSARSSSVFSSSAVSSSRVSSSVRSSSALSSSAVSSSPASSSAVSSSAVSSSAVSSSVPSSSAAASSSSSSSSTSAAAFSDPRFRGFWGQSFYVEGVVGGVYSLLSSQAVQVNARFTYRSNVSCPQQDGHDVSNCFQEAGTYFGSLAVRASTGDWLRVVGGGVAQGFASVTVNGHKQLQVGDVVTIQDGGDADADASAAASSSPRAGLQLQRLRRLLRGVGAAAAAAAQSQPPALRSSSTPTATHPMQVEAAHSTLPTSLPTSLPTLTVTRLSARQLRVQAGDYTLHIDNMDGYVDLSAVDVQCWACLEQGHLSLDGLLGQTWNSSASIVSDEEGVEQFRVQGDDEAACSSAMHDRHCSAAA